MGGTFDNDGKLTKLLNCLISRKGVFEYDAQLEPLDAPYVAKHSQSQSLVTQQQRRFDAIDKPKRVVVCSVWV